MMDMWYSLLWIASSKFEEVIMPLNFIQFNLFTLQSFLSVMRVIIEFLIIWIIIYYLLKIVRNNSRTVQIFKGILVIFILRFISNSLGLTTLTTLLDFFIQSGIIIIIIIFQPEIRAMLERLGKTSVFSPLHSLTSNEKEQLIQEIIDATVSLSKNQTGALITLEQGQTMGDFIKTGTPINSTVTAELLRSIFVTSTPLHDGAVIIQGDRIASASAYYPPTEKDDLPVEYGARHRAALGISEITDSITIVVSEETGKISIAENGVLTEMDEESLKQYLNVIIQNSEKEVSSSILTKTRGNLFSFNKVNIDPLKIETIEIEDVVNKPEKRKEQRKEHNNVDKLKSIFASSKKKSKPEVKEEIKEDIKEIFKETKNDEGVDLEVKGGQDDEQK